MVLVRCKCGTEMKIPDNALKPSKSTPTIKCPGCGNASLATLSDGILAVLQSQNPDMSIYILPDDLEFYMRKT